jgi:hypothetical protein
MAKIYLIATLKGDSVPSQFGPFEDHVDSWGDTFDHLCDEDGADLETWEIKTVRVD